MPGPVQFFEPLIKLLPGIGPSTRRGPNALAGRSLWMYLHRHRLSIGKRRRLFQFDILAADHSAKDGIFHVVLVAFFAITVPFLLYYTVDLGMPKKIVVGELNVVAGLPTEPLTPQSAGTCSPRRFHRRNNLLREPLDGLLLLCGHRLADFRNEIRRLIDKHQLGRNGD